MAAIRTLAAAGLLLTSGCLLELDTEVACGDGYIDRAVGEQCEPGSVSSFRDACRTELGINRPGACSPACEIDLSACYPACGNGVLDEDEECDPGAPDSGSDNADTDGEQIGTELSCTLFDPLDGSEPYAGGVLEDCRADCTWDRAPCHHCGDGQVQQDEACDGNLVDLERLDQLCLGACLSQEQEPRPARVVCDAHCSDTCGGYVVDAQNPGCCIPSGHPTNPNLPCCNYEEDGQCKLGLGE